MRIRNYILENYGQDAVDLFEGMPFSEKFLIMTVNEYNNLFPMIERGDNLRIIMDKIQDTVKRNNYNEFIHRAATVVMYANMGMAYDGMRPFVDDLYYKKRTDGLGVLEKLLDKNTIKIADEIINESTKSDKTLMDVMKDKEIDIVINKEGVHFEENKK